ncbi:hypothetical protein [Cylindrospermum sp. FACHB-282]|uniref:hypothetical protein n=1 Tax=Cylindrospermum sp. FACHB-282 TaxID=2692794 RepID=UPI0016875651|nr:hypothetical protein [Cylindrospermum sp. FACHB-282]MBD2388724.1 hypothetical protein [Cylindrospermum sp. FACHB-282]
MLRSIEIEIDDQSWGTATVPTEIAQLKGTRNTNVLSALIHTALWTRPPVTYGFHLSDFWACLRYYPAIAGSSDLRLCKEWNSIDPHQKTILSDELGVGFTTQLLIEKLGCKQFADTLHVVKTLPHKFHLPKSANNGKYKSPDYIGFDSHSNYYVLECKGSQSSKKKLKLAVDKGIKQKSNLTTFGKTKIKYSLVAGLFIAPEEKKRSKSCIHIADPSWEELNEILENYTTEEINTSISQITLAKHLSLIGLNTVSRSLANTPTEQLRRLPDDARSALNNWLTDEPQEFRTIFDTREIYSQVPERTFLNGRFRVQTPNQLLAQLIDDQDVSSVLRNLSFSSLERRWSFESNETMSQLISPFEFGFQLEFF